MTEKSRKCGLYVISPENFGLKEFSGQLVQAFSGGQIDVFQLRLKNAPDDFVIEACRELIPICHENGAQFILNDYYHLAGKVGADGVHIGIEDGKAREIRKVIGSEKILGVSCYGSIERAIDEASDGADYVAFGAFYPTTTKTPRARPKPDILKWWVANSVVPCVAIGGITAGNCRPLVASGADFIAVVSAIWKHESGPAVAVREFGAVLDE